MPSNTNVPLIQQMELIAKNYIKAKYLLTNHPIISDTNYHTLCSYIQCVVQSFRRLKSSEKRFLNNEFFFAKYDGWWKSSLSLNEYKKMQLTAITHFLDYFYEAI